MMHDPFVRGSQLAKLLNLRPITITNWRNIKTAPHGGALMGHPTTLINVEEIKMLRYGGMLLKVTPPYQMTDDELEKALSAGELPAMWNAMVDTSAKEGR